MREILLNGVPYQIKGEVVTRAINPFKSALGNTGSREFSDFTTAEVEEYHDFRDGIGLERGLATENRTLFTEGIDLTTKGRAVLGPLVTTTSITAITAPTITNADMELDSDWTTESGTGTRSNAQNHTSGGTYSWLLDDNSVVYQNQSGYIQGQEYTFTCWVYSNIANRARIAIDDGVSTTYSSYHTGGSSWEQLTVTKRLSSAATKLALELNKNGVSGLSYWDDAAISASAVTITPVKILDFQGGDSTKKTYAIGNNIILKWNGTAWDVKGGCANPIDAIVVTDDTDEYLIVSSALNAYYTTDGATWTRLVAFGDAPDFTTYTEVDANAKLTVTATKALAADADTDEDVYLYKDLTANALDGLDVDFEIFQNATSDNSVHCGMAISNTVGSVNDFAATDISVLAWEGAGALYLSLWRGNAVASDAKSGLSLDTIYYCSLKRTAGSDTVTCEIYSDSGRTTLVDTLSVAGFSTTKYRYVYGFINRNTATGGENFDGYVQNLTLNRTAGYMADYANRLYFISTDGKNIHYSSAKNIDAYGDDFSLTGNYGTVYDLFEGKLLADGTAVLYFCGTEGLYTIDVTNEKAYKQEVEYPPLTYSGHKGMYWNASVWVATGFGILKVTPNMATFVGPDQDDGLPETYQGSIFDMVTVNNWLVYCVNKTATTDKSSILKRNASYGGSLQVYTSAANQAITCLHHSPSSMYTNGMLWFGEGTDVKNMMFPDTTSNVKQISTYTYVDDSGYGKLPIFRRLASIPKVALGLAAITKSCKKARYVEVYYGINDAAATTKIATFNTSPRDDIATFGSGVGLDFYTIQFALKLIRGSTTTNSPELESLLFYWIPRPAPIHAWTFKYECSSDVAAAKIAELEAIRDTTTLVVFNETGDASKTAFNHYVVLSSMPLRFHVENKEMRRGTIDITVEEVFNA